MYASLSLCCLLIAGLQLSLQVRHSQPNDAYYIAGVVEFRFSTETDPNIRLLENLKLYLSILASPEAIETDIIIFPEATLNSIEEATFVPDPLAQVVPCDDNLPYHTFLIELSCQAKLLRKYLVINVSEKEDCSAQINDPRPCAADDLNRYNTNVVFDRNGAVISRYRKVHIWGEPRNTTYEPEFGFFDTDFGVRFGHFICFDILFYAPAQHLVDKLQIRDIIFPTMWFSQLPFLTGVQFQHSWAFGNDVNLLAAGSSRPELGTTGTGIYHGRTGSLVSVMQRNSGEQRLYVARVPKYHNAVKRSRRSLSHEAFTLSRHIDYGILLKRDNLELYKTVVVDLGDRANASQKKLCYDAQKFCCNFDLAWQHLTDVPTDSQYYTYRMAVYAGPRNEENVENNHVRNCAIFACTSGSLTDCGTVFASNTSAIVQPQVRFTRLSIEARYPHSKEFLVMPNSLKDDLLPFEPTQFLWEIETEEQIDTVRYTLNTTVSNLLTFAIYGNYYDNQASAITNDASDASGLGLLLILLLLAT